MDSPAAPQAPFRTPEGAPLSTADVVARGHGLPVLLAFFKTSCPVCQLTWPYLERLHEAYGGRAVHVVGVSQNDGRSSRAYYAEFGGATFDLLLDPEPGFAASNAFDVEAVPHLVLLSPRGIVLDVFAGWSRKRMEALGARFVEKDIPFRPVVPPGDPVRDFAPG